MKLPNNIQSADIPAVSLGLYHAAKKRVAGNLEPKNSVEFTLTEQATEIFDTYLTSMRTSVKVLTENK